MNNNDDKDDIKIPSPIAQADEESGEASESGENADLESDDDVMKQAHQMGIGLNDTSEHPEELNIAKDINDAEDYQKDH